MSKKGGAQAGARRPLIWSAAKDMRSGVSGNGSKYSSNHRLHRDTMSLTICTIIILPKHYMCARNHSLFPFMCTDASDTELEEVEGVLRESTSLEYDNKTLCCPICQLSFSSLNNKQSHFSGRLHRQSLVEYIHKKLSSSRDAAQLHINKHSESCDSVAIASRDEESEESSGNGDDILEQVRLVATKHKGIFNAQCMHRRVTVVLSVCLFVATL